MPADHSVCLVGNRGFVDDCVVDSALNAVLLTPILRKDVMNIQRKLLVVDWTVVKSPGGLLYRAEGVESVRATARACLSALRHVSSRRCRP